MNFVIHRKTNFGPNLKTNTKFDPTDLLCSPGVKGANFVKGNWVIELEKFSEVQDLAEEQGAISVVFRPGLPPAIIILEKEVPTKRSA